jgi:hypothetical protein
MAWCKSPLVEIALLAAALAVLQPAYWLATVARGQEPLGLASVLFSWSLPLVVVLWIVADAKQRRCTPCFDYGFFLILLWPISLFWYCTRKSGWRGFGLALGLFLLPGVPALTTAVAVACWTIATAALQG